MAPPPTTKDDPVRLLLPALLTLLASTTQAATPINNATELRDALRGTAQAAELQDIALDSGCGPSGCMVDIGPLRILREEGQLQRIDGKPLHWQAQPELPELDWSPLGAYQVSTADKPWGICLELSHSGIGKSGVYQRWSSLVLVPADGDQAYRLVGYWTGCDSLQSGPAQGQVQLPIVSQHPEHGLQVQTYRCDARTCQVAPSATAISEENGILQLP